ncbi:hypothetical protein ACHHYP_13653 [Achlya hypogyna]|uniref:HMG box domain-containing protein n=1 Tax=Achlya hypogyna TaxID=1202772 RepID=A0A1V9ZFH9_ACHHY|nr:hypothetical protein ACHHYP_13653 [Achlya hypogyna]
MADRVDDDETMEMTTTAEIMHMADKSDDDDDMRDGETDAPQDEVVDTAVGTVGKDDKGPLVSKPQSAYFHFLAAKRGEVKADNPGAAIGAIQKILGTKWKELTSEEKEPYIQLALDDKERYAKEKAELLARGIDIEPEKTTVASEDVLSLPCARVKRIINADQDVSKVSKDALIAITKATELFIKYLAAKGYDSAMISKRKTIKDSDLIQVIHGHGALDWLRDDFPQTSSRSAVEPKAAKVSSRTEPSGNAPSISSFFQRA